MRGTDEIPETDVLAAFRLDDRVAVVTGASSGLGRRFAQVLHDAGASVVVAARRVDRLQELSKGMKRSRYSFVDMSDDQSLQDLASFVDTELGGADILVNNAGIGGIFRAETDSIEKFRELVDVNLVGLFRLTQLFGTQMLRKGGGTIVNIGSVFGSIGGGDLPLASYCATKSGVNGLTRDLACQWARKNIRVNVLAPGYFRTEMTAGRLDADNADAWIERNSPMNRFGADHELDGALLFLASDASSFMTGQVLTVDGGWSIR